MDESKGMRVNYPALFGWFFHLAITIYYIFMEAPLEAISMSILSVSFVLLLIAGNQK